MAIYETLVEEGKQLPCEPLNPCCEKPCDKPSFWELLPKCNVNWIAYGFAAFAIGFGIIALGYINIGAAIIVINNNSSVGSIYSIDPTLLNQGMTLISIILGGIILSAWILFKTCSNTWRIVAVGALIGASGFPVAAIGLIYLTVAQTQAFPTGFNTTWFNIALTLVLLSIAGFLFSAFIINANSCGRRIDSKKAIVVSLIFLGAGWAAWSFGRLLWIAVVTYQEYLVNLPTLVFPASAFITFISVSIINIVLAVKLGQYVLYCASDNCYTVFLPFFATAAPLGNWALYRVAYSVLSYTQFSEVPSNLSQFAYAIGFISIAALFFTFGIAKCGDNGAAVFAASAFPLLYAIAIYTYVSTAANLEATLGGGTVDTILQGIFLGIAVTAGIDFFSRHITCPIPSIFRGIASGTFGFAIIFLYSTYNADVLSNATIDADTQILNIGISVILSIAIISLFFTGIIVPDEFLRALVLTNIALLTAGAAGFIGTIAYFQSILTGNTADVRAATTIYVIFALTALFLPLFFAKCEDTKRQLLISVASLASGITAVSLGQAIVFSRAIAFTSTSIDFSPLVYIAAAISSTFIGQFIVWIVPQASIYAALIATFIGLIANGIGLQIIYLMDSFNNSTLPFNSALVGAPWLAFTIGSVALLLILQLKSLCIPQNCHFLAGLLIPALGIAVFAKVAGASAAFGIAYCGFSRVLFAQAFAINSAAMLVMSIIPLAGFLISLKSFECTSCLAYFPSSIAYTAVIYVTSQFKLIDLHTSLSVSTLVLAPFPLLNFITAIYNYFDYTDTVPADISAYATFITQTGRTYILFLAPAFIAGFIFLCSKSVSAAVIGSAIAATAVSFGAYGVANAIVGALFVATTLIGPGSPITDFITFSQFLGVIRSQFVLLIVGVITVLIIFFEKCRSRC